MALYGKYRPQQFSDMVGQISVKNTLLQALKLQKTSHAYLFCGTRGTGKTSSARILAKAINCLTPLESGDPDTTCEICQMVEKNRLTDIIEIDAASNRGIDEIRDLRDKVSFAPNIAKAKVYIIDEVHMMTKEAFNALLKTLEEPPAHAYFILATTEFHKVPETIRSRCQTFFFRNIALNDIVSRLEYICKEEGFEYETQGLKMIAGRASGGLRDAISLLEQSSSYGPITPDNLKASLGILSDEIFATFFATFFEGDDNGALKLLDELQDQGRSLEEFCKDFIGFLRDQFHVFLEKKDSRLPWILEVIEIFTQGLNNLKSFSIPPLALEMAVAKVFLLKEEYKEQLTITNYQLPVGKKADELKIKTEVLREELKIDESENHVEAKNIVREEQKRTEPISPEPKQDTPAPVSQYEDMDMLPPWEDDGEIKKEEVKIETPKQEVISEVQNDDISSSSKLDLESLQKNWKTLCGTLPSSLKLNLIQYGTVCEVHGNTIVISISSTSTQSLLSSESNIKKAQDGFSKELGQEITIEFTGEKEETPKLEVDEVMNLLDF